MNFISKIRNLINSKTFIEVDFTDANTIENLNGLLKIKSKSILTGEGKVNLHLEKNVSIEVLGKYSGKISAAKGSYIKLVGTFTGRIQVEILDIKSSGHFNGELEIDKIRVQSGAKMNTEIKS
jgi:cytoskeletal protein CcmA (bactofilin family)